MHILCKNSTKNSKFGNSTFDYNPTYVLKSMLYILKISNALVKSACQRVAKCETIAFIQYYASKIGYSDNLLMGGEKYQ